ncbi:hypothetical protein HAHE_31250 [Haloferula helveola]|uniref:Exosortase/archaeosortase family protein n=2 Tax=Haloferula helveola TaxID=490095 RepID=A0ABN6H8H6_9BACT|nr:hypothetical protein HAHE_31250 [Haloferula helveola]
MAALTWLGSSWNVELGYEHAHCIPFIMLALFIWRWRSLRSSIGPSSSKAIPILLIAACLFFIAHRIPQPRIAVLSLPMLLWGSAWYFWGWKVAKLSFSPLFLLVLAIPFPSLWRFSQFLEVFSTKLCQITTSWFGIEVNVSGSVVFSSPGSLPPLEISQICGGNFSLKILMLVASVWACLATMAPWKKLLLILAVVPIEIIGNGLRLTSIFVIYEHGDPEFAQGQWWDWSGLLLLYPVALTLIYATHALLKREFPKLSHLYSQIGQVPKN